MEKGDTIQIKGWLGFAKDTNLTVLEVKGDSVKTIPTHRIGDTEGLLSRTNESWYGIDFLKSKMV